MVSEFKDTPLNLIRWVVKKNLNGLVAWKDVAISVANILRKHMETDPEFKKLCIIIEDDAFRMDDKKTFSERINHIFPYLEKHVGKYSHFQGGGVDPIPKNIENKDPFIIRCDYITCATFTIYGKEAANSVFDYEKNIETIEITFDNYIGQQNRGKILVPFPHLVWQIIGIPSTLSSEDQKVTLNEAFREAATTLRHFVNQKLKKRDGKSYKTRKRWANTSRTTLRIRGCDTSAACK
jgi:hypothetical protein